MKSSEKIQGSDPTLTINADADAWITIFDGYDKIASDARRGTQSLTLPRGIYTVRCERAGFSTQKTVRLVNSDVVTLASAPIASAAPIAGAVTTHEYYHGPSTYFSLNATAQFPDRQGPAWLFFFIRPWDQSTYDRESDLGRWFELQDAATGKTFAEFGDERITKRDKSTGWVAFSSELAPGFYTLRCMGPERWAIPIHLYPGRSSQVFVLFHHKPLIESVRIFIRRLGRPFEPSDVDSRDVDLALTGLANGIDALSAAIPEQRERDLLKGKFHNPMFGLIGAHWLLARPDPQPPYVDTVLSNLRDLLPGSPDVDALEILAASRLGRPHPIQKISFPPLLSASLRAICMHATANIEPDSLLDQILVRLRAGSPWCCWNIEPPQSLGFSASPTRDTDEWLQRAVMHQIARSGVDRFDPNDLATEFHLPARTIQRARENLQSTSRTQDLLFAPPPNAEENQIRIDRLFDWSPEWPIRGALVYDEAFPSSPNGREASMRLTTYFASALVLKGNREVYFRSDETKGWLTVCDEVGPLLDRIDKSAGLCSPRHWSDLRGFRFLLLTWSYDLGRARLGDLGLGSAGPEQQLQRSDYSIIQAVPGYWGAAYSLTKTIGNWLLPNQIKSADDILPGSFICVDLAGSITVRFKIDRELQFHNVDPSFSEKTPSFPIEVEVGVSGICRVRIARYSTDPKEKKLNVSILAPELPSQPALSVTSPIIQQLRRLIADQEPADQERLAQEFLANKLILASAEATLKDYDRIFAAQSSSLQIRPWVECELDFGNDPNRARQVLTELMAGSIDLRVDQGSELNGVLVDVHRTLPKLDMWFSHQPAAIEPYFSHDIVLRGHDETRSAAVSRAFCERLQDKLPLSEGRVSKTPRRPFRCLITLPVPKSSSITWILHTLFTRFSPSDPKAVLHQFTEFLNRPPEDNAVISMEVVYPAFVDISWIATRDVESHERLTFGVRSELRFWLSIFAMSQMRLDEDLAKWAEWLVYKCLRPEVHKVPEIIELDMLGDAFVLSVGELRSLFNTYPFTNGADLVSPSEFCAIATRSSGLAKLLEMERAIIHSGTSLLEGRSFGEFRAGMRDFMETVERRVPLQWVLAPLQLILLAAGGLALSNANAATVSASLKLDFLRSEATFPPSDVDLHHSLPLHLLTAQARIENLDDTFAQKKYVSEEPGEQAEEST